MKTGVLITTFLRDEALFATLRSIYAVFQDDWYLIIGDQGHEPYSDRKTQTYAHLEETGRGHVEILPFDCGLSHARNILVSEALRRGCKNVILGADSIKFNFNMAEVQNLENELNTWQIIGLNLENRIPWEAELRLVPGKYFELDFIEKDPKYGMWQCDIVRNFFYANAQALEIVEWDAELKLMEHEDFFWRFKKAGFKVACTKQFSGTYIGNKHKPLEYATFRRRMYSEFKQKLLEKYNIKSQWNYLHLERTRNDPV